MEYATANIGNSNEILWCLHGACLMYHWRHWWCLTGRTGGIVSHPNFRKVLESQRKLGFHCQLKLAGSLATDFLERGWILAPFSGGWKTQRHWISMGFEANHGVGRAKSYVVFKQNWGLHRQWGTSPLKAARYHVWSIWRFPARHGGTPSSLEAFLFVWKKIPSRNGGWTGGTLIDGIRHFCHGQIKMQLVRPRDPRWSTSARHSRNAAWPVSRSWMLDQ